jgi:hypothetical protein
MLWLSIPRPGSASNIVIVCPASFRILAAARQNTLSLAAHLGIKTFPVRTYMSCSWLFEDRTETWILIFRFEKLVNRSF